ncbi:hypothetical protein HanXRQr2_Chr03g0091831 [Helianthus annuus]|uniref:Uncharacterized protein n=1 Tax=Helianthus annuus TaxID=4232 RepID=A0A251V429_HELAN|nr:hypothetical protein HanXRQr2_Chr03g0091831 [Helianthus annuus]
MVFCAVYSCTISFMVVLTFGCTWSYSHRLCPCFIKVMETHKGGTRIYFRRLGFHCELDDDGDFRFSGG